MQVQPGPRLSRVGGCGTWTVCPPRTGLQDYKSATTSRILLRTVPQRNKGRVWSSQGASSEGGSIRRPRGGFLTERGGLLTWSISFCVPLTRLPSHTERPHSFRFSWQVTMLNGGPSGTHHPLPSSDSAGQRCNQAGTRFVGAERIWKVVEEGFLSPSPLSSSGHLRWSTTKEQLVIAACSGTVYLNQEGCHASFLPSTPHSVSSSSPDLTAQNAASVRLSTSRCGRTL